MLESLEIKNFRVFSHLAIRRLGRVNLVVGKNNVGKTTLLEALRLYASIWPPSTVESILDWRDEVGASNEGKTRLLLHSLFPGRRAKRGDVFRIGPCETDEERLAFVATAEIKPEETSEPGEATAAAYAPTARTSLNIQSAGIGYRVHADGRWGYRVWSDTWKLPDPPYDPPCLRSVRARKDPNDTIQDWWDAISLSEAKSRVIDALQLIAPIRDITYVGDPRSGEGRMAKARVEGVDEPVALASLGDGTVRIFQLAVALEYAAVFATSAKKGDYRGNVFPLLLIDEVESGIHHTLHTRLWRFILQSARELGVQVFATTHSWDCLEGFAQAVAEDEQADALAIRLERVEGEEQTGVVSFDRDDLPIVVRDSIEVR